MEHLSETQILYLGFRSRPFSILFTRFFWGALLKRLGPSASRSQLQAAYFFLAFPTPNFRFCLLPMFLVYCASFTGCVFNVASVMSFLQQRDLIVTERILIEFPKEEIEEFCKKHSIRKLSLFGSALRDDFTPESDLGILVEFDPSHIPGLIRLAGMELELGEILGRKVDMRTAQDLSRYFRDEVLKSALVQYAEG